MTIAKSFILANPPSRNVQLDSSKPDPTFSLEQKELPALKEGEVLAKTIYLSNDASQRSWIQKGITKDRMYVRPVFKGEVMRAMGIAQVVESKLKGYEAGEFVTCTLGWSDYVILRQPDIMNKIVNTKIPLSWNLDVVGITGLTAYFGLFDVAQLKATDTIVISGASGATGSMCVQIAKKVIGAKRVIGISGGPEKCRWVESIGADVCVDYKDPKFYKNMIAALGPEKQCDVFFDGVGGRILDSMLTLTKQYGRVVACGSIAGYDDPKKGVVNFWGLITVKRISVKGFIVLDYVKQFEKGVADILSWIEAGKIKVDEKSFSVIDVTKNFEGIPEAWGVMYSDKKGSGKLLTKVGEAKL